MSGRTPGPGPDWFDVEAFRRVGHRVVLLRQVTLPALVLGSTQDEGVVDRRRAARAGIAVVRRRSGGGVVLVGPGDPLWVDLWIPRRDPLFDGDVGRSALWVGDAWLGALEGLGLGHAELRVHRGSALRGRWSDTVCFAGVAPGEVLVTQHGARGPERSAPKVVGVAQWRGREGALFHSALYRRWDPGPLVDLLAVPAARREPMIDDLRAAAVGLEDLGMTAAAPAEVTGALLASLPDDAPWSTERPT